MKRVVSTAAAAFAAACLAGAFAQDADDAATGDTSGDFSPGDADGQITRQHEPAIDQGLGASELDTLSHGTTEDPFPMIDATPRRKGVSVTIRALNKIVARYTDIEAKVGEPAKFGSLEILPRYCDTRPPEEFPETSAFLEIFDRDLARARAASSVEARDISGKAPAAAVVSAPVPAAAPVDPAAAPVDPAAKPVDPDRIFSGWMFASSPGLNPLEHPVYDVWVIGCKTVTAGE